MMYECYQSGHRLARTVVKARACLRRWSCTCLAACLLVLAGCSLDSYLDPSTVGYWESTPTSLPILSRLDAIETSEDPWGQTTTPTPEDLVPNDLTYRLGPGDLVTIQIYELFAIGQWSPSSRRVDHAGNLRVQQIGDLHVSGRTVDELHELLVAEFRGIFAEPVLEVVLEEGKNFTYTVYGEIGLQGIFTLDKPGLTLLEALASAGGVTNAVEHVYVMRQSSRDDFAPPRADRKPGSAGAGTTGTEAPIDIEALIEQLEDAAPVVSPSAFREEDDGLIDIDDLNRLPAGLEPPVDIVVPVEEESSSGNWIYLEEQGGWIRVYPVTGYRDMSRNTVRGVEYPASLEEENEHLERVIKISVDDLKRGGSTSNLVIRPGDRIYCEEPLTGIVYLDGQVARPGPYGLVPNSIPTLSRLVTTAGGLGPLAVPDRVDLVRIVGKNREATIRLNLAAIRNRTEPDVILKPDDHIIVGTAAYAYPLAVIRNGFRATYGFGFLLDRNFGNDVFGPPPFNSPYQQ